MEDNPVVRKDKDDNELPETRDHVWYRSIDSEN